MLHFEVRALANPDDRGEADSDVGDRNGRPAAAKTPDVSLIIPTFREFTFQQALDRLLGHLAAFPLGVTEILVVDDSDEATQTNILTALRKSEHAVQDCELRLIPGPHQGKGAAVRMGVLAARGHLIFLVDADLPVALRHLNEFVDTLRAGDADAVVAERPRDRYRDDRVRYVLSRGLYAMQRVLVFRAHRFDDTQCGFKVFRAGLLKRIAAQQVIDGGMYDLEYLYVATRFGARIVRVPVEVYPEVRPSRINVWRCLRIDPIDIGRLVFRGLGGHYR